MRRRRRRKDNREAGGGHSTTNIAAVGLSLLRKADVQSQKIGRLDRRLREQARSHRVPMHRATVHGLTNAADGYSET
nr:hypothetical protein [Tanacetum cinerariifolium]